MSIGEYGFIVFAVDTEGNLFGLHSRQSRSVADFLFLATDSNSISRLPYLSLQGPPLSDLTSSFQIT
jgi:hypothetical protein